MTVVPLAAAIVRHQQTIGGSEAAAACGVDPYRSRVMLWAEKSGLIERPENEAMLWGKLLEPVVFAELERRGLGVMPAPADGFRSNEYPWLSGHPDGFWTDDDWAGRPSGYPLGILEVKTAGPWSSSAWREDDAAPLPYLMQLHHYFALTGREVGLLACLVAGQRLELRTVERDDTVIARMLELEEEFLDYLERETPPPPDGSDSASDALRALYPNGDGGTVRLDKAHWKIKRELEGLKQQADAIKRQAAEKQQQLEAFMGEASEAISPHDELAATWKLERSTRLNTTRLKTERPDVYGEFVNLGTRRRFLLK